MEKLDMTSMNVTQENIKKIQALFPNVVTEAIVDGKVQFVVDFDALKEELSTVIVEGKTERYQFTWPEKSKAKLLAAKQITSTLRPCKEESVDFDTTKNLYIEGDNLDVLKLLQETYLGKIKMIYIDPPYNTGNDFVYEDDFTQTLGEYSTISGDYDDIGNRMVKNVESNGRFHTDWLNMIYPRLKIAKDLLSEDGVIFISIDDNEQENLKKLASEVFGERNFVAQLVWEKKKKGAFLSKNYINMKEYVFVYAKNNASFGGLVGEINSNEETYPCIKTTNARGIRIIRKGTPSKYKDANYCIKAGTRVSSGNMELIFLDDLVVKNSLLENDTRIDSNWIYSQTALDEFAQKGFIYITQDNYIRRIVGEARTKMLKDILLRVGSDGESLSKYTFDTNLHNGGWGTNEDANDELHKLLDQQYLFDFSKPVRLIAKLIQTITDKNALILDFFSGSGTTAQAVMSVNAKDDGNRRFILVQLPEICEENSEAYKAGYKNICEIGKERIRRAGLKIKEEAGLTAADLDIGFRVLKLDSSNMQDVYYNPASIPQSLLDATIDNIKPDRTAMDLLFQVMLSLGIELSAKIEEKKISDKAYYVVNDNELIACFDENITNELITEIAKMKPIYATFRDSSFASDSVGINNEQLFKTYSPATTVKVI